MAKESKGATPEAVTVKEAKSVPAPKAVKEEPVKEVKAEAVKEAKSEAPKAAKAEPKRSAAVAKKSPGRPKKSGKEKEPMVPEMFVQYDDTLAGAQEASVADIVAKVKAIYVAQGHRESSIKSLRIYMKPQMWKAYYVINHKIEGDIDLF